MSNIAIRVENLGKQYRIGRLQQRHDTLRDQLSAFLKSPHKGNGQNQKSEESIWALKDVSFEINRGEVVGLIGRNGAGKTTLLKVLSRITEPTEGIADLHGRVGSLLEVGTGFHPELTGRENIFLSGAILGMHRAEIDRKFDEIVAFSEIEKFLDTPVKRYSSGMYVRLAFAVAAHLDPEILLVDEVLAVGDTAFQKKCLGKMGDATREGRTVVFVSHNMGAIEGLCSRVFWLDGGSIKSSGLASRIVSEYLIESTLGDPNTRIRKNRRTDERLVLEQVLIKNERNEAKTSFFPGEKLILEIQFFAGERIERPYFWLSIANGLGPVCGADMTVDGLCPEFIGPGEGKLECAIDLPLLAPQSFTLTVGVREKDAMTMLINTTQVGAFRIEATAGDYGFFGPQADASVPYGAPIILPYEWRMPDGRVVRVDPHPDFSIVPTLENQS
jgi:lipopolysaccharide transport system ATP-binding protein